ncbi:MAG: HAD family phosphatase, partial [Chloroflexi bacterium]
VLSGALKLVKPDPRIFEVFLEQIGRKPEQCLFIDDSRKNIEAANSMGFQTIRFESPEQLERELRERGIGV